MWVLKDESSYLTRLGQAGKREGQKQKHNERRNSLQAKSHMQILTVALGISTGSGHALQFVWETQVQGINTACANIAFLPQAQREQLQSRLLPLETPWAEVRGHTLPLWSHPENRTGFVTCFNLPCLPVDREIEFASKSLIYVLTNCFTSGETSWTENVTHWWKRNRKMFPCSCSRSFCFPTVPALKLLKSFNSSLPICWSGQGNFYKNSTILILSQM